MERWSVEEFATALEWLRRTVVWAYKDLFCASRKVVNSAVSLISSDSCDFLRSKNSFSSFSALDAFFTSVSWDYLSSLMLSSASSSLIWEIKSSSWLSFKIFYCSLSASSSWDWSCSTWSFICYSVLMCERISFSSFWRETSYSAGTLLWRPTELWFDVVSPSAST